MSAIDILANVCIYHPNTNTSIAENIISESAVAISVSSEPTVIMTESVSFNSPEDISRLPGDDKHREEFRIHMGFFEFPNANALFDYFVKPKQTEAIHRVIPKFFKEDFPTTFKKKFDEVKGLYLISYLTSFNKIDVTQQTGPNGKRLEFYRADFVRIFREKIASNADTLWDPNFSREKWSVVLTWINDTATDDEIICLTIMNIIYELVPSDFPIGVISGLIRLLMGLEIRTSSGSGASPFWNAAIFAVNKLKKPTTNRHNCDADSDIHLLREKMKRKIDKLSLPELQMLKRSMASLVGDDDIIDDDTE